jgi:hypothetical protein
MRATWVWTVWVRRKKKRASKEGGRGQVSGEKGMKEWWKRLAEYDLSLAGIDLGVNFRPSSPPYLFPASLSLSLSL